MDKKIIRVIVIAIAIIAIAVVIAGTPRMKKVNYEFEPVSVNEIDRIRGCVKEVTGSETLDIEELLKDQILLSDVYRYCLKTVEDQEAILKELAR